ncbi:MAG: 5-oxoprolinase subunit PxpA [Eubacteriales bacterium]|nr:5-oxoprolinase subunit PxpA [Eubacteriales bacterium]
MYKVDLNSDLGESFGHYEIGFDRDIIKTVSSVNIACGVHAGDPMVMDRTVKLCTKWGTAVGAHPGFPDLQGFGRRQMHMNKGELKNYIIYQLGALSAFARKNGTRLQHVKPHGALNNMMPYSEQYSREICEALLDFDPDLILVAPTNTMTLHMARDMGLRTVSEVFADRAYQDDGYLLSRSYPEALLTDEDAAIERVIRMIKEGVVTSVTGKEIKIQAESVCIHSDTAMALNYAHKVRKALENSGITICNMEEL